MSGKVKDFQRRKQRMFVYAHCFQEVVTEPPQPVATTAPATTVATIATTTSTTTVATTTTPMSTTSTG